jgi:hypothetical protein
MTHRFEASVLALGWVRRGTVAQARADGRRTGPARAWPSGERGLRPVVRYDARVNGLAAPNLTPLELPAWLDFVADRSGLRAERLELTPYDDLGRAVLFLDRRKRIQQPSLMPYLPVVFRPSKERPYGRTVQWHRAATGLVDRMRRAGVANHTWLPLEIVDVRPWSWLGFRVDVAYGYVLDLPWAATATRSFARLIARAGEQGVRAERTNDTDAIMTCIAATEGRRASRQAPRRRISTP